MSFRVKLITDFDQWSNLREKWDELLSNSTAFEARIFLSYEWLTTWWKFFGRGKRLMLIAVFEDEKLLASAPLFVAPSPTLPFARILRFIGNGNADYGDFLVREGRHDAAKLIWQWLFANRNLWDAIALHELPENNVAIKSLAQTEIPHEIKTSILVGEICHRIPLDNNLGSWRERANKSLREQLKRRERQIARNFSLVEFSLAKSEDDVERAMNQLFAMHRLRWGQLGQTGVFVFPKVRKFHIEFAKQALKRNWLRLHRLFLDNSVGAAYYAFSCDGYSGFYTCGFNPKFARYSVGKVLLAKVIDDAQREGAKVFDFMRGNETYKAQFGTKTQTNLHLFVWQENKLVSRTAAILHKFTTWLSLRLKEWAQR